MDALLELAISARGCVASSMSASRVTVAFVLERVLDQCTESLDGRSVQISEIAELANRFHQPISRAVDYLAGASDDPIDVAAALIKARPARHR